MNYVKHGITHATKDVMVKFPHTKNHMCSVFSSGVHVHSRLQAKLNFDIRCLYIKNQHEIQHEIDRVQNRNFMNFNYEQ